MSRARIDPPVLSSGAFSESTRTTSASFDWSRFQAFGYETAQPALASRNSTSPADTGEFVVTDDSLAVRFFGDPTEWRPATTARTTTRTAPTIPATTFVSL